MKSAFDGPIRLDIDEGGICGIEDMTIETPQTEKYREKRQKKNRIFKNYGTIAKGVPTCLMGIPGEGR